MSRARVTLLSLIKRENQTKDLYDTKTQKMEPICTLVDKDDMTKISAFEMIEAAKVICIAVKRWLFKKWRKSRYYVVDIYFDADHDIADKIYIVGDFTFPKWTTQIPMKYSFFHRSFMARVKIHDNSQFKFIVDGTYICCPTYPMTYSPDKFTNNVFKINKIRHYSESRSFSEFKGSSIRFIKRSEELYRLKNSHILNLIAINSKINSNLLYDSKNNRCPYFSPDVNFGRKVLNHSEYIIPFCNFQNQFSTKNLVMKELTSTMNSTSKLSESDCFKAEIFETKDSGFFPKNPKISHIVTKQSSKTPMSLICNPLRANIKREENKSQRDEFSDLSDEDLFFIDDYFRSNTITTEDKIYLTNSNGVM